MNWNSIDGALVLLVVLGLTAGWRHGFLLAALDLLGLMGSFLLALRFYQPAAQLLQRVTDWPEVWALPVAFLLVFVASGVLVRLLGAALVRRLPARIHTRKVNRALGLIPGFLRGLLNSAIAATLLLALPLPAAVRTSVRESQAASRLAAYAERVEIVLRPVFGGAIRQTLTTRTIRPESSERVQLPFTVSAAPPVPDLERQMLDLVNRERVSRSLGPLVPDPGLTAVARRHSADMFRRGYFAHVTPEGLTPFDRMTAANIRFLAAGENLALAPTLTLAHTNLMNSPGHRANILRPQFGRAGIGILDGGLRGLMVTQLFRD